MLPFEFSAESFFALDCRKSGGVGALRKWLDTQREELLKTVKFCGNLKVINWNLDVQHLLQSMGKEWF